MRTEWISMYVDVDVDVGLQRDPKPPPRFHQPVATGAALEITSYGKMIITSSGGRVLSSETLGTL